MAGKIMIEPSEWQETVIGKKRAEQNYAHCLKDYKALRATMDPETLEAIADEIDCFEHSARAASLRGIAKRQTKALA